MISDELDIYVDRYEGVVEINGNKQGFSDLDFFDGVTFALDCLGINYTVYEMDNKEDLICSNCSGSGEGMHEGTTCFVCKGTGTEP